MGRKAIPVFLILSATCLLAFIVYVVVVSQAFTDLEKSGVVTQIEPGTYRGVEVLYFEDGEVIAFYEEGVSDIPIGVPITVFYRNDLGGLSTLMRFGSGSEENQPGRRGDGG